MTLSLFYAQTALSLLVGFPVLTLNYEINFLGVKHDY